MYCVILQIFSIWHSVFFLPINFSFYIGITGSLYCFNRGFKRMLIAGMIASVPGLLTGVLSMLACRASNSTFEELYAKYLNETQKI